MEQIMECIPNFSTSDEKVVEKIVEAIKGEDVTVLDIDIDKSYNRTVITIVGNPLSVGYAMIQATEKAIKLIDMRKHKGEHPRIGAVDVIPLVPVQDISMDECIYHAQDIAEYIANKLAIPAYCYGEATIQSGYDKLARARKGQYEGLEEKLKKEQPDFGPSDFSKKVKKSGAILVGARNPMIAYNINLETRDIEIADSIAKAIRESGVVTKGKRIPGIFKDVQAIGVEKKDLGITQVSINILDYKKTPLHIIYRTVQSIAKPYHTSLAGSEIIGLVPKEALVGIGENIKIYDTDRDEKGLIKLAEISLGLNNSYQDFDLNKTVLEYAMENAGPKQTKVSWRT